MCHVFLTDMRRLITTALRPAGNGLYGLKNLFNISSGALK
jgi:hypothetical protein